MRDINTVALTGRSTKEPDLKYTKSGLPVLTFALANNYSIKILVHELRVMDFHKDKVLSSPSDLDPSINQEAETFYNALKNDRLPLLKPTTPARQSDTGDMFDDDIPF